MTKMKCPDGCACGRHKPKKCPVGCTCRRHTARMEGATTIMVGGYLPPTYKSWRSMVQRCTDRNVTEYPRYGGRGITVCDRWLGRHGYDNFLADMGERPKDRTLDRIDNDGNYEPSNCRWATGSEQQRNRNSFRKNHCKRGHLFSEVGTYTLKSGGRQCAKCAKDRANAYDAKKEKQRRYMLTAEDVAWIRANHGVVKQKDMVTRFGVSKLTIAKATRGEGRFKDM